MVLGKPLTIIESGYRRLDHEDDSSIYAYL